jgi:HEPN domain-containing protein
MREHEHWHLIALEDLDSAKHLCTRSFMTTLFHIQQCAEKALKSYIVLNKGSVKRIHDLVQLVNICMEIDNAFEELRPLALELDPYETVGRYPDKDFKKMSQEKMQKLIEQSEFVFNFTMVHINKKNKRTKA